MNAVIISLYSSREMTILRLPQHNEVEDGETASAFFVEHTVNLASLDAISRLDKGTLL